MRRGMWMSGLIIIIIFLSTGYLLTGQVNLSGSQMTDPGLDPEIVFLPYNQADAKGEITNLKNNQIFVEEYPQKKQEGSKGLITLDSKTKYFHRKNGELITGKREDLKRGSSVTVWCRGAHIMIYPLQCTASHVLLESDQSN